jgi:hypothetical protein
VDRLYNVEYGDLHGDDECEYNGDGQLHGGGDYRDHGDSDNSRHNRDIAAVCGNGDRDRKLHERRYMGGDACGKQYAERWDDHIERALPDALSGSANGDRNGDKHL